MDTLITSSQANFASTTGFTLSSAAVWMGDNLAKPFIGGGLTILYELRYWIIALVALSAVIYFAYRAFRFYKH